MAFEKIKVANPIVEMDGEISFSSLDLSISVSLSLIEYEMITFACLVFIESFVVCFWSDLWNLRMCKLVAWFGFGLWLRNR